MVVKEFYDLQLILQTAAKLITWFEDLRVTLNLLTRHTGYPGPRTLNRFQVQVTAV